MALKKEKMDQDTASLLDFAELAFKKKRRLLEDDTPKMIRKFIYKIRFYKTPEGIIVEAVEIIEDHNSKKYISKSWKFKKTIPLNKPKKLQGQVDKAIKEAAKKIEERKVLTDAMMSLDPPKEYET